jgi:hypothetical protein
MKPKSLGKGDKSTISGDPNDQGLNLREGMSNSAKLRGETSVMKQQPEIKKSSISSDRGKFKCR